MIELSELLRVIDMGGNVGMLVLIYFGWKLDRRLVKIETTVCNGGLKDRVDSLEKRMNRAQGLPQQQESR